MRSLHLRQGEWDRERGAGGGSDPGPVEKLGEGC